MKSKVIGIPLGVLTLFCLSLVVEAQTPGGANTPQLLPGYLKREVYTNIIGMKLADLTNNAKFPEHPDVVGLVNLFESPSGNGNTVHYGVRLSGFIVPPATGEYQFYLASDDEGALFLSTDEARSNLVWIAWEPAWSIPRNWLGPASGRTNNENISPPIMLEAGKKYYVEALMQQAGGGDALGVAWKLPGGEPPANGSSPIEGRFLATHNAYYVSNYVTVMASDEVASEMSPMLPAFDTGAFKIKRTGPTNEALPVFYSISGTATPGVDYQTLPGCVTIPAGATEATVLVYPIDDLIYEPTETVVLTIEPTPISAAYGFYLKGTPSTATVYIRDNDPVTNHPPVVTIVSPKATNIYTLPTNIAIYATVTDADGLTNLSLVEFFAGSNRLAAFTGPATPNSTYYYHHWTNPPAGQHLLSVVAKDKQGAEGRAQVSIVVNRAVEPPRLPVVTVVATDAEAAEPNPVPPGMGMPTILNLGEFTISRTGPTNVPLAVFFSIASNSASGGAQIANLAINGVDFELIESPVVIPAGATSVVIQVIPIDDALVEPTEVVWLNLFVPVSFAPTYSLGQPASAMVYILDNDQPPPPVVTILATDAEAAEPNPLAMGPAVNSGQFTVYRTGPTNEPLTVSLVIGGTAENGVDYMRIASYVTIPAGATSAPIAIVPLPDNLVEGTETVRIGIPIPPVIMIYPPVPPAYMPGTPSEAEVRILDYPEVTNHPPAIAIVSPRAGAQYIAPASIYIRAETRDTIDQIRLVEFFAGDQLLGYRQPASNSGSFTLVWTNVMPGEYSLSARATDAAGSSSTSAPVRVVVSERTPQVIRCLPAGYAPGATLLVRLQATPTAKVLSWAVEDQPPAGWTIGAISEGGAYDAGFGKVKFGPFLDNAVRALTYELTPPTDASGVYHFSGTASFDGASQPIGGASVIGLRQHPADISPADWRITMDELTAYSSAWRQGASNYTTGGNPSGAGVSHTPISFVTRAGMLWKGGEFYTLDPVITTPPLCWVNLPTAQANGLDGPGSPAGGPTEFCPAQSTMPANYASGAAVTVSLVIQPKAGTRAYAVEETVPAGWVVSAVSDNGLFQAATRKVRWGPFMDATGRTLTYTATPALNAAGVCAFQGVASFDGVDVPIAGRRVIAATGTTPPATINSAGRTESGLPVFTFLGEVGRAYLIEYSTDLVTWFPVSTVNNTTGVMNHTDTEAPTLERRYYRARLLP